MAKTWVNGQEEDCISGDDPGLTLGWNAFETFRSYGSAPFRLDAHVFRLEMSLRSLGIPVPDGLRERLLTRVEPDSSHRITVTAGGSEVLTVAPIRQDYIGADRRVACVRWDPPSGLSGTVKHGSRLGWMLAARERGVDEVLLVAPDGAILEANRSSVIAVVDGVLVTPPLDGRQLIGVTRAAMLDAAREADLPMEEAPITSWSRFDELYLCSTLKELSPVVELDGRRLQGRGPVGTRLHSAFRELVARETRPA